MNYLKSLFNNGTSNETVLVALRICCSYCGFNHGKDHPVAGCRGINNYTLVNVLPSCTETDHSQQEVLTLTQMSSPVTTGTSRRRTTPRHNTPWQRFKTGRQRPQTTQQDASTNTSSPQPLVRISTPNNAAVNTEGTPHTSSPGDTTTTTAGLPTRSSRQITWRPHSWYVTHYGAHSLKPKTRALPHSSQFYQKGMSTIEMTTKEKTHSLVMNLATISKFVVAPTYYDLDRLTKLSFSPK